MNDYRELNTIRIISAILFAGVIILWSQNADLKKKVDACWWEISAANGTIADADDALELAHAQAWSDYNTMGTTLENLDSSYQQVPNPCDNGYTGDLSSYPSQ